MKISKTMFKSYVRCERYAALDEVRMQKESAVVAFKEDATLEDLMSFENQRKIEALKEVMTDVFDDDDDDDKKKKNDNIFQDDFDELERLAARKVSAMYPGVMVATPNTMDQKYFKLDKDFDELYCFLDIYQEDDTHARIFEVKATTSKKFFEMVYTSGKKEKSAVFAVQNGIFCLNEQLLNVMYKDYVKSIQRFFNRTGDYGKYVYDLAYQAYVIEKSNTVSKPRKYYLAVLNHEYVYDGVKDQQNHHVYSEDIISFFDFTPIIPALIDFIDQDIHTVIRRVNTLDASPVSLGNHCQKGKKNYECPFIDVCYQEIPKTYSMFSYMLRHFGYTDDAGTKHAFYDLINDGMKHALDLPDTYLNVNQYKNPKRIEKNIIQKEKFQAYINHQEEEPFVRKEKINDIMKTFKYPLYHLDFETLPSPLPKHQGEKPYQQSLFQFSIHIEHEPSMCDYDQNHVDFLATNHVDQRRDLVEAMLDYINDDGGTIIVWNEGFEKGRIKEMMEIFPEYAQRLKDIHDRVYDLMKLFAGDNKFHDDGMFNYYHHKMQHSFSIKKVLPIFSERKHADLIVQDGGMAMETFIQFPELDEKTFKAQYEALRAYCKLDTYAMVEILDGIRKIINT